MATGGSSSKHKPSDFSSSQNQGSDFSSTRDKGSDFSSSLHKGSTKIDIAEQCQDHKGHKLDLFCEEHDVLICSRCLISSHKKCTERVVLIDEKVKKMQQTGDFTKLIEEINALKQELTLKKEDIEGNTERLQMVFEEQLDKINTLRKTVNQTLDELESNTIKELNTLLETLKVPLQDDIDKCIDALSRIQNIQDEIQNIDKNTETLKLLLYRKYSEKSSEIESMKSQMVFYRIPTIKFIPDPSIKCIFSLSSFGKLINLNEILKVTKNTKYGIPKTGFFSPTFPNVSAICETATGALLITYGFITSSIYLTDRYIGEVILLDKDFKLVTNYKLPSRPWSMCSIDSSLVAVALDNKEVHFIRVTNVGRLEQDRKLKLEHECRSIAYHQDNLYITSGTALYHYTVSGRLVNKIYEDLSRGERVKSCAVSTDGINLYVGSEMQLVTLSRDGTVINKVSIHPTIEDDDDRLLLHWADLFHNLHVTDSGQVLISSSNPHKILQMDSDGRQVLAEVVTEMDGAETPISFFYSKQRASLFVGMFHSDHILVFKT